MRPEAFKKINYSLDQKNQDSSHVDWESLSFTLLYVNLFCLVFFSVSVLSTHQRLIDFFAGRHKELPRLTKVFLETSSYEYMVACIVAGLLLVIKEKNKDKRFCFMVNLVVLFVIWLFVFLYIWGVSLPFAR